MDERAIRSFLLERRNYIPNTYSEIREDGYSGHRSSLASKASGAQAHLRRFVETEGCG